MDYFGVLGPWKWFTWSHRIKIDLGSFIQALIHSTTAFLDLPWGAALDGATMEERVSAVHGEFRAKQPSPSAMDYFEG
jgi:hypothetical protein